MNILINLYNTVNYSEQLFTKFDSSIIVNLNSFNYSESFFLSKICLSHTNEYNKYYLLSMLKFKVK
jgi:hypothetical protein